MKLRYKRKVPSKKLNEKTYTIGDTQYWKRAGKCYKWTVEGGRSEISEEDYNKALASVSTTTTSTSAPAKPIEDKSKTLNKDPIVMKKNKKYKGSEYAKATDQDLIDYVREGDADAQEYLINKYEPLVHKIAGKYFIKGGDDEDILQTGRIGIWNAIDAYDPSKNDNFFNYVSMHIDGAIKKLVRSDTTNKSYINNTATSLHAPAGGEDSDRELADVLPDNSASPEEQYLGKEGAERLTNFMKTELTPKELNIINKFIQGYTISEIAEMEGVKYKSIENAITRVRYKIKDFRRTTESKHLKEGNSFTAEERALLSKIINKILSHKDLAEAAFNYKGKDYVSAFGHLYIDAKCVDDNPEEWYKASEEYHKSKQSDDSPKKVRSTNKTVPASEYAPLVLSEDHPESYNDLSDSILNYLQDNGVRYTRPIFPEDTMTEDSHHSGKPTSVEDSAKALMEQGLSEVDAREFADIMRKYTKDVYELSDEDYDEIPRYLKMLPKYTGGPIYRGMCIDKGEQYDNSILDVEPGDYINLWDVSSFTTDPKIAMDFANVDSYEEDYEVPVFIMNNNNHSGVSVNHISMYPDDEQEVLVTKDSKLKVIRRENFNGIVFIHVEESVLAEDDEDSVVVNMPECGSMHDPIEEGI